MQLTPHLKLVPRLRMCGGMLPWYGTFQSLGTTLSFLYCYIYPFLPSCLDRTLKQVMTTSSPILITLHDWNASGSVQNDVEPSYSAAIVFVCSLLL